MFGIDPMELLGGIRSALDETLEGLSGALPTMGRSGAGDWLGTRSSFPSMGIDLPFRSTPAPWLGAIPGTTPAPSNFTSWRNADWVGGVTKLRDTLTRVPTKRADAAPSKPFTPSTSTAVMSTPAVDTSELAERIVDLAKSLLGDEGARVVRAILQTEGGLGGAIGDTHLNPVGSHGPFQFYGGGGQLNNFARDLGVSLEEAGRIARTQPLVAAEWALRQGGYLGDTIRRGLEMGLTGPELATYAQRYGQVSVSPERAGENYRRLFGG